MWRDIARFEWRLQLREFLTWVYVAVFFFLTFGYTSSSAVELVSGRDGIARNAPWALAHAMAGVTAFGQVITTMIAATAVMRDVATRTQELLFATRVSRGAYLGGRYAGAFAVMCMVYAAIPLGLLAGTVMPWVESGTLVPFAIGAYVRPLVVLVLPNVVVVSALFFVAGALRRSFVTILLVGLGLVVLWTTGTTTARAGAQWGALIDPFGNAALEWMTRDWTMTQRRDTLLPLHGVLLANRVLWLLVASGAWWALARTFRLEIVLSRSGLDSPTSVSLPENSRPSDAARADRIRGLSSWASTRVRNRLSLNTSVDAFWAPVWIIARWTARWVMREKGFRTLVALGALNALANAWPAGGASLDAGMVLATIQEHVRVFLILTATIYAGELVWRERDVRCDALIDALPCSTGAHVSGRIGGLIVAEGLVVAPLVVVALGIGGWRHARGMTPLLAVTWVGGIIFPFFVAITSLSLFVHALLQNKVAGHVTLIVGWVLAVAMDRTLALPLWARFANLPPFAWTPANDFGRDGMRLVWTQLYWLAIAAILAVLASAWWSRGLGLSFRQRGQRALRQMRTIYAPALAPFVLLAIVCAWFAGHE